MLNTRSADNSQPLLGVFHFNYNYRPARDVFWGGAYLLMLLGSVGLGVYSVLNRNMLFHAALDPDYMRDPAHCPVDTQDHMAVRGGGWRRDAGDVPKLLLDSAGILLGASVAAAALLSVLFLGVLQSSPRAMVALACVLQVLAPVSAAVLAYQAGNSDLGTILVLVAAGTAAMFALSRDSLELVARLLGVAAAAFRQNPAIIALVLGLKVLLIIAAVVLSAGIGASATNGTIRPNPERMGQSACHDRHGSIVPCCVWAPDAFVPVYVPLASTALAWTVLLIFEIKVFTISGTVAQWYFSPVGAGRQLHALGTSLGHAFGSSFGSLCLASAFLSLVAHVRALLARFTHDNRRQDGLPSLGGSLLGCCFSCLMSLLEQLTKFATVHMAMSGQSFLEAGHAVVQLMRRNGMDAYNMWWYMPLVLHTSAAAVAAAWGYAVYWASAHFWHAATQTLPLHGAVAAGLGVLAGAVAWLMLAFVCSVLLNVSDAMFLCYVLDRDSLTCTRPDVHDVYRQVPGVGGIIEHPDGVYAYAAPQIQYAPTPQRPAPYPRYSPSPPAQHPYYSPAPVHAGRQAMPIASGYGHPQMHYPPSGALSPPFPGMAYGGPGSRGPAPSAPPQPNFGGPPPSSAYPGYPVIYGDKS